MPSPAFWSLDLSKRNRPGEFKWTVLPSWPGPARLLPVAAAQQTADGVAFFLFSGRAPQAGRPTRLLRDAYAFDPTTRRWRTLQPISGSPGLSVMAGTAASVGNDEVLLFGGDRGDHFLELEAHDLQIDAWRKELAAANPDHRPAIQEKIDAALRAKRTIYERHPGFGREVLAYDTRRDAWRVVMESPLAPQVTTLAVTWGDAIVIPSGEIRPGVRTPKIVRVQPVSK